MIVKILREVEQIGDLNVANEIIELYYQVIRIQLSLDRLFTVNQNINLPLGTHMADIEKEAISMLQKKVPQYGYSQKVKPQNKANTLYINDPFTPEIELVIMLFVRVTKI